MLSVEWSCLEAVTNRGGFLRPMLEFVKVVSIGSKTDTKCPHALCYLDTLYTLGLSRVGTMRYINRRVVSMYLAHTSDSSGSVRPMYAIPEKLEQVQRSSRYVDQTSPSLRRLLHKSREHHKHQSHA